MSPDLCVDLRCRSVRIRTATAQRLPVAASPNVERRGSFNTHTQNGSPSLNHCVLGVSLPAVGSLGDDAVPRNDSGMSVQWLSLGRQRASLAWVALALLR